MMKPSRSFILIGLLLMVCASAFAQGTTGSLTGTVIHEGAALPGVTVTINSPALQGTRTSITNESGQYNFGGLPPGEYTVTIDMEGMQSVTRTSRVTLGGTSRIDADLRLSAVAEAITVTASAPAVMETTEVQTNFDADLIEDLPIGRTLIATTTLAPGVVNGVNGLAISGSNSYDNLWTVNGAIINEGIRGQPHNLFIEDAIQETTIQTAGVSAEYGYFTGGVINAITKSGGNEFSGSFRDSLTNPDWSEKTPFVNPSTGVPQADPPDELNEVYEATLGGRIIRDRLWFFLAGRYTESETQAFFTQSNESYIQATTDERLEVKLTGSVTPNHTLIGSYLEAPVEQTNNCQIGCFDFSTVNPLRTLPNEFTAAQYNGIFGNDLLLEARWSEKTFAFVNSGGLDQNLATGTPVRLVAPGFNTVTNEPYFCGSCGPEARDNEHFVLKGTYFLGTENFGTHNLVVGAERFHETRQANNFQSPTNFVGFFRTTAPTRDENGNTLISVGNNDWLLHFPILQLSEGSDLNTDGLYINDKWDLNQHLTFQLGARYDRNDSKDSAGNITAKDDKISPRLGVAYDVRGDGRLRLNASYGTYVNRLSEGVSGAGSAAGNPATFIYVYGGEPITNLPPEQALAIVFAYFESQGGVSALPPCSSARRSGCLLFQSIPGFNSQLAGELDSPSVDEWTIGFGTQIGNGFVRLDYIDRDWQDFYTSFSNLEIGAVTSPTGARADLVLTGNSNDFDRTYEAVEVQGGYRLFNRVNIGANYTWSELEGNVIGETTGNGPVATGGRDFRPEYIGYAQNNPHGTLPQDQTHKARLWASIDVPTFVGDFNFSLLQRYDSGGAYSLAGTINPSLTIDNPGYVSPTTSATYFFSDRGEFRFKGFTATDLAINYGTGLNWLGGLQLFIQGEVINVFNEDELISHDTSILTSVNTSTLETFNPFTETPVEGVHWRRGANFGKATSVNDYQDPRTYRVSAGIRF